MSMVDTIAAFFEDSLARHGVQFADMEGTLDDATAALRAMETPTEAMVEAGLTTGARFGPDAMRNIWRTMIRAAVAEGER
jgi:hypothetical protein